MKENRFLIGFLVVALSIIGWMTYRDYPTLKAVDQISIAFLPGQLSNSHAFLESQCTTCHSPNQGVSAVGCISCHANNANLLQRQSTAFHGSVTSCKECHQEHRGGLKPPLLMDHLALAKMGASAHEKKTTEAQNQIVRNYLQEKRLHKSEEAHISVNALEPALISSLDCVSCHATRDKHQGNFGTSCLSCHSSQTWSIAEYRHPSPNSRTCTQCHQAPPSHYMMHFEMVSKTFAGQEHAKVNQCFLCHQTTSWNDIKGKGWYKHH